MAFTPRRYPLVDVPQVDPIGSLTQLMYAARNMQAFEAEQREQKNARRAEQALQQGKGDPLAAATILEQQGDFVQGRALRSKASEIHQANRTKALERITQQASVFGQAEQALNEVTTKPELYPDLRPKLMDLAAQVDPRLAQEIPEQYDEERVRGMVRFTQSGAAELTRNADALKKLDGATKRAKEQGEIVRDYLEGGPGTPDARDAVLAWAPSVGILPEVVESFKDWTPKTKQPTSVEDALLDPKLTPARKTQLLALEKDLANARRAPDTSTAAMNPLSVQAVLDNPGIWGDLPPTMRAAMLPALAKGGFDFGAAAKNLTKAQEAVIERWRAGEEARITQSFLSDEEKTAEIAKVQQSARVQRGLVGPATADQKDAGSVPSAVSSLLKNEPTGRYTVSDGSVWEKAADGSIRRAK